MNSPIRNDQKNYNDGVVLESLYKIYFLIIQMAIISSQSYSNSLPERLGILKSKVNFLKDDRKSIPRTLMLGYV